MKHKVNIQVIFFISLIFILPQYQPNPVAVIKYSISKDVVADVDSRIFGHFLEKPSWDGETGVEAAFGNGEANLIGKTYQQLKSLNIPIIRFPGGTDIDHTDWKDMIDNVPTRIERPKSKGHRGAWVTNEFGYDETLELCEKLGAEALLVVNFGDAYYRHKSIKAAALEAASLVAYCNAPVGSKLPDGMYDWPSVRAKNGREKPYDVKYFQIANEPWVLDQRLKLMGDIDDSLANHYYDCVIAYIDAMKEVDPNIEIIVDGNPEELATMLPERIGKKAEYVAFHSYYPWQIKSFKKGDQEIAPKDLKEEEVWNAWTSVPNIDDQTGLSVFDNDIFKNAKNTGYKIAVTEWNWNGWWEPIPENKEVFDSHFAKGVGAAGFIHAMMRDAGQIEIGCQSMLVGSTWGITGVRVSPEQKFDPYLMPTGQVTGFYSKYHGNQLLDYNVKNAYYFEQPYKVNDIEAEKKVAYVDALVTRSKSKVFFHAINRDFSNAIPVELDLKDLGALKGTAIHHQFLGNIDNSPVSPDSRSMAYFKDVPLKTKKTSVTVMLPARSVSIIEIDL